MHEARWRAPTAPGPIDAAVALPGSKSMTNRALVLAALADGESVLRRPLRSRDSSLMVAGLRALGCEVRDGSACWRVRPFPTRPGDGAPRVPASNLPTRTIDVGNAGTVLRFLLPVAALAPSDVAFDGDPRARQRPLAPLITGLRGLGVDIADGGRGAVPLTVRGRGRVPGGRVTIDASDSSQLVSGLLLSGSRFGAGVEVRQEGRRLPSRPHVAMTVAMLRARGVHIDTDTDKDAPDVWRVAPGPVRSGEFEIEPDVSNAAPFLAAALVTGGRVRVPGWPDAGTASTQPGDTVRELLAAMGAWTASGPEGLTVCGTGRIYGIDADLHEIGELVPTLAALAALARSPSRLRGIAHLRGHETDRLDALARELGALGTGLRQTADGLEIHPRPLRGGVFHVYADHRLATAGAVLGLAVPGIEVDDITATSKTLPAFTTLWSEMLGETTATRDGAES